MIRLFLMVATQGYNRQAEYIMLIQSIVVGEEVLISPLVFPNTTTQIVLLI